METQYLSFTVPQIINSKYFVIDILHITVQEQKGVHTISMGSGVFDCTLLCNDNSYHSEQRVNKMYSQSSEFASNTGLRIFHQCNMNIYILLC
jgi:hypothetical protein